MDKKIIFETSPWFIIVCMLTGLIYSLILYKRKNPWTTRQSFLLGFIRFLTVSLIAFLLLGPLIRQIQNIIIKPSIVIVIDNSQSITYNYSETEINNLNSDLNRIIENLSFNDYQIEVQDLGGNKISLASNFTYDQPATNLSKTLNDIEDRYEGRNLSGVILISDGIYNQGMSPVYENYSFPLFTVGIGDTVKKQDIILKSLLYNKIVYQGNRFPLFAEISNYGYMGEGITIDVIKNNQTLATKTVSLPKNTGIQKVEFELKAENSGIQRYIISVRPKSNEFSRSNNSKEAYIEIVEGKEKILLLAPAPHPDIKVLRNAILKNDNYELQLVIPEISDYQDDKYDLAILHQLPDNKNTFNSIIENLKRENTPLFYILGSKTNITQFNNLNRCLTVRPLRNQFDNVFPALNTNFTLFNITNETQNIITDLPPILVPFGEYTIKGEVEVILFQQIGKIITNKPLLTINKNQTLKEAVLAGEGTWQWRLNEYMENFEFNGFDGLFGKIIQYLSAKEDKRKFRVYPVNNEQWDNEPVVFETEIYNDIYEKIYGQRIDLIIRNENDSSFEYSYIISPANSRFRISGLDPGVYQYTAKSVINGENAEVNGMFSVKKMQIETTTLTANHNLLKELARQSGGQFYAREQMDNLQTEIKNTDIKSMIVSSENYLAIINLKWLFFLILMIITIEWGVRKYLGGY